jgi:hypothetical protein
MLFPTSKEKKEYLKGMVLGYLNAGLWVQFDEPNDLSVADISLSTKKQAIQECGDFLTKINYFISGIGYNEMGFDFYLTRTHQGAGFWDRGMGERGDFLTKISHEFRDVTPIIGDDNKIYFE